MSESKGNIISDVFIISLERSLETRYVPLIKRMRERGVAYKKTKIEAIDGRYIEHNPTKLSNNTYACLLSHIKALEQAQKMNLPCVLIIEDDVDFVQNFSDRLEGIMQELPNNWQAMWLGGRSLFRNMQYSENLYRMVGSWGGYGYIVRNTLYKSFIHGLSTSKLACDDYYRRVHIKLNCYRPKSDLVIHMEGFSDRQEVFRK